MSKPKPKTKPIDFNEYYRQSEYSPNDVIVDANGCIVGFDDDESLGDFYDIHEY